MIPMIETRKKYAELVSRWLRTVGVGFIIVFGSLLMVVIIRDHNKRLAPFKPMLSEAEELDLSFDQVVAAPDQYINKHVIWCVQNRSKDDVHYRGDSARSLTVFNHQQMPLEFGSKHASCADMLLQIKGAKPTTTGAGAVGVIFILALQ